MTPSDLEARIRLAIRPDDAPAGLTTLDAVPAIEALSTVLAEVLAHVSDDLAAVVVEELMACRRQWRMHPRALAQLQPSGSS